MQRYFPGNQITLVPRLSGICLFRGNLLFPYQHAGGSLDVVAPDRRVSGIAGVRLRTRFATEQTLFARMKYPFFFLSLRDKC